MAKHCEIFIAVFFADNSDRLFLDISLEKRRINDEIIRI